MYKGLWFVIVQDSAPSAVKANGLCAYSIRWDTPVACPRNATISGTNGSCTLTDPATGVIYDLQALARKNSDYAVNNTGRSFKVLNEFNLAWPSEICVAFVLVKPETSLTEGCGEM